VAARVRAFLCRQDFLEELLARTQPRKLDVDVLVGLQAVEADQLLGDVHDHHGLAHVQHEDLAALSQNGRLQNQRNRLRNRHEIALHFPVRHGQRPAVLELLQEERQDAAPAAQHVPKAHGHEFGTWFDRLTMTICVTLSHLFVTLSHLFVTLSLSKGDWLTMTVNK